MHARPSNDLENFMFYFLMDLMLEYGMCVFLFVHHANLKMVYLMYIVYQINFDDEIMITEWCDKISKQRLWPSVIEEVTSWVVTASETGTLLMYNKGRNQSTVTS